MSAGHRRIHAFGLTGEALDRVLNDPEVRERLLRPRTINKDYDMPYVGGYSTDGSTIYLDRHLPDEIKLRLDGQVKVVRTVGFLAEYMGHEPVEWSVMDALGWSYEAAHAGPATGSERRKVLRELGPHWWQPWQTAIERYVKADAHEKITKVPADYDFRPVLAPPVDKRLLAHMQAHQEGSQHEAKHTKQEVDYGPGMAKSHCGPTPKWRSGDCVSFEPPHGCAKVRGYIEADKWCKEWRSSKSS